MFRKSFLLFITICFITIQMVFSLSAIPHQNIDSESLLNTWEFNPKIYDYEGNFWDDVQISLITLSKADPLYSWFGHSSLKIDFPDSDSISYDYGIFSFSKGFYKDFALGRMYYQVQGTYSKYLLDYAESLNRTISEIKLDLTSEKKKAIVNFLIYNTEDENCTYLYHHYKDNCATRIRDILNFATNGELKKWAIMQPGTSYRIEAGRVISVSHLWLWFLNFLQSGNIDKQNTLWENMFLPENLEKGIIEFGKIGKDRNVLLDNIGKDGRKITPDVYHKDILFDVSIALLLIIGAVVFNKKGFKTYNGIIYIFLSLLGSLLFFMMTFTTHDVTWHNENIIFINPILFVVAFLAMRGNKKAFYTLNKIFSILCVLLIIFKLILPNIFFQDNWAQIISILPFYIINGFVLDKVNRIQEENPKENCCD